LQWVVPLHQIPHFHVAIMPWRRQKELYAFPPQICMDPTVLVAPSKIMAQTALVAQTRTVVACAWFQVLARLDVRVRVICKQREIEWDEYDTGAS
jgi:hypothetical protein